MICTLSSASSALSAALYIFVMMWCGKVMSNGVNVDFQLRGRSPCDAEKSISNARGLRVCLGADESGASARAARDVEVMPIARQFDARGVAPQRSAGPDRASGERAPPLVTLLLRVFERTRRVRAD